MLLPRVITAVIGLGVILPAIHYGGFFYMALVGCIIALCLYEYGLALTAGKHPVHRFSLLFFSLPAAALACCVSDSLSMSFSPLSLSFMPRS